MFYFSKFIPALLSKMQVMVWTQSQVYCIVQHKCIIKPIGKHLHSSYSVITPEKVLSKENQDRCVAKLKSIKAIRLQGKTESLKKAAVLIPLCVVRGHLSLIYTLRSADLKNHRGQVSFPGGMQDTSDGNLEETAMRETYEEMGINKSQIHVWGHGNFIGTRSQDMAVLPVVGFLGEIELDKLELNPREVESVFSITLQHLCDPRNHKYTQFRNSYVTPAFVGAEHRVWGLTAIITHFLLGALLPDIYKNKLHYNRPVIEK